jgi:coatomer subunit beta
MISLDLATVGEIRLCERPGSFPLGPGSSKRLTVNLKVSSTESGVVFGTISLEGSGPHSRRVINLAEVSLAIMDYIKPAHCSDAVFRQYWQEFEWENKVAINTRITDIAEFIEHIVKVTNMALLNADVVLKKGEAPLSFLSANLFAKSIFDEDALCNVSVEKVIEPYLHTHILANILTTTRIFPFSFFLFFFFFPFLIFFPPIMIFPGVRWEAVRVSSYQEQDPRNGLVLGRHRFP